MLGRKLAFLLLALIALGAAALSAPGMTTRPIPFIDLAFIAASAVCVTGLATIDLGRDLTFAGQAVVLALIQSGAFGVVLFASLSIMSGRRLSLGSEMMLVDQVAHGSDVRMRDVARGVLQLSLAIEAVGAVALFLAWPDEVEGGARVWASVFHAVSAFCNAGMSIFPTNLEAFPTAWGVNIVVMALIVLGGFGFVNLQELGGRAKSGTLRWRSFSLFLKVAVVYTLALVVGGWAIVFLAEYGNGLAHLTLGDKLLVALFQSVTTRTAGFTTLPLASFTDLTLMVLMALMFVGGASGGFAGGVKITTIAVVGATIGGYVRNDEDANLFGRRIPFVTQRKAFTLIAVAMFAIAMGVAAVDALDFGLRRHEAGGPRFAAYLFEVVSALGTVGLSLGITAGLAPAAKVGLIVMMFVGRLGPLLMIGAWLAKPQGKHYSYPEEGVPIG